MQYIEHDEQAALIRWWAGVCESYGLSEKHLFAIPNGGQRNRIVASRLKDEGVRAGVPDLFLAVPINNFSGLFIEMKKPKGGRVTDVQKEYSALLNKAGYKAIVACGFQAAQDEITDYLAGAEIA